MNPFPSEKILKRMGYFSDQEGIIKRFIDEESNWRHHLANTKEFICNAIEAQRPENVAILGSGWLLDVPIEYLSKQCKHVYLYDIRHPRQIVHKLKNFSNITLINADITGGAIEEVYTILNSSKHTNRSIEDFEVPGFFPPEPIDFIVSVNILNQLDNLIIEYLRKFPLLEKAAIERLQGKIQSTHIQSILKKDCCLITDYQEMIYDRTDNLISTNSLLFTELPKAKHTKEWLWNFDTQMTYYPNRKTIFKVIAIQH